jgi:hypothetical protein
VGFEGEVHEAGRARTMQDVHVGRRAEGRQRLQRLRGAHAEARKRKETSR